jgi:histidine triad (HIT) family protein
MEDSVFTKIIKGEIPCHKVYEDDKTFAFLTINPLTAGHVLVIPKKQVDNFEELSDEDYIAVFNTVKHVAKRVKEVYGTTKAIVAITGFEVPHAHVHVLPSNDAFEYVETAYQHLKRDRADETPEPNHAELAAIAQKLAF